MLADTGISKIVQEVFPVFIQKQKVQQKPFLRVEGNNYQQTILRVWQTKIILPFTWFINLHLIGPAVTVHSKFTHPPCPGKGCLLMLVP